MRFTTHADRLVRCSATRKRRRVDAVVVPTSRPPWFLPFATDLAHDLDCPLLLLCSGESRAADVAEMLKSAQGAAVTLTSSPSHPYLLMRSTRPSSWLSAPYLDTANKRNVALLTAKMLGWRRILMLDDDISGLDAQQVRKMAALMIGERMGAIGWQNIDFPDNSVACHAYRESGRDQDVFIGAGALLVDVTGPVPFFPAVYNEDWFFWHDIAHRRRLGQAGTAWQVAFNPFADPARAHRQEFGDVLAEGLYSLMHEGRTVLLGCLPSHWPEVIEERREMLRSTEDRLWGLRETRARSENGFEFHQIITSVQTSMAALENVRPDDLARFTTEWRLDLHRWTAGLHRLPSFNKITDALNWLNIRDVHVFGGP